MKRCLNRLWGRRCIRRRDGDGPGRIHGEGVVVLRETELLGRMG